MQELTFWTMLFQASFFIQFLMLGLFVASVIAWVTIFQRWQVFHQAKQQHEAFKERFWSGIDLNELFRETDPYEVAGAERVVYSGFKTLTAFARKPAMLNRSWKGWNVPCASHWRRSKTGCTRACPCWRPSVQ